MKKTFKANRVDLLASLNTASSEALGLKLSTISFVKEVYSGKIF